MHPGPVGVTGSCMGARLALRAAGRHPQEALACGGFHGGGLATDAADSPHPSLAEAGLTAANEIVPGATHGYSMADTAAYDQAAAERHFSELGALPARTLGGRSGG